MGVDRNINLNVKVQDLLNSTTCTIWLQHFWLSIVKSDADCDSKRRPKAKP